MPAHPSIEKIEGWGTHSFGTAKSKKSGATRHWAHTLAFRVYVVPIRPVAVVSWKICQVGATRFHAPRD